MSDEVCLVTGRCCPLEGSLIDRHAFMMQVNNLRSALSSLTTRLVELTDRLAAAEADLAACRLVSEKSLREHADATLATRALATVWETRWREERRAREAAEASLRVLLAAPGPERCLLNGQSTTAGGTITTLRVGA
jgi:hypothetical protein